MSPTKTPRAVQRVAQIEAIKGVARRLIAEKSVSGLSLREVAREMGLVSSALYRYFATREDLLTALILDAYNDLGASVEGADAAFARTEVYARWCAATTAVRRWAKMNPHEYALIYGTPTPGYQAPPETIEAAARVARVLGDILNEGRVIGDGPRSSTDASHKVSTYLEVGALAEVMPDVAPGDYVKALMAWTQIFGFLTFELFGHYVGTVKNANRMFDQVVDELARSLDILTS
ncbi:MAG TPA: TetR/AcrR family transcriptional regulator [Acidimicrobiales bacterium]|nr:TetR/AcrR family transcriptional regulator [Acidimicrobiales bacterium]